MKHLLFAVYIFSVLYCYLQLNIMIDRCLELFKERYPTIPIRSDNGWKGVGLSLEILGVSAVPVINLLLGYLISTINEPMISEIVDTVECNHWQEIQEMESELKEKIDLDKYF